MWSLSALPFANVHGAVTDLAVVGSYGNFDAANFEGREANGFEVQIEGLQPADFGLAWGGNMFGLPVYVPYATGTYVRYQSPWDPATQRFTARTVPITPGTNFGGTCYAVDPTNNAGCDHFGVHPINWSVTPRIVSYRWMFPDPLNPGQLIASANNIFVPTPVYYFVPAAVPANPPELVAEVEAPPAAEGRYGDATWMKVYETELSRPVALEELVSTNALVPQTPAQIETEWDLVQASPPGGRKQRGKHSNQRALAPGTRAVVRRYETYAYTGAYDPVTHEALCGGDGSCSAPLADELGDLQVAQMTTANVAVPGLTVNKVGSGSVSSADKILSCGSKCAANYALGTLVTLTAQPASNYTFAGWGGACSGAASTCAVTVNDALNVTATFNAIVKTGGGGGGGGGGSTGTQFTLSVGRSNSGTVSAIPNGTDRTLDCGSTCSARFPANTTVTLTATPLLGKSFLGWSGACTGTTPTCAVTMSSDKSTTASFSK